MFRPLLVVPIFFVAQYASAQPAQLVLNNAAANNHPFIVFNPAANSGTYLVIDNPNPSGITELVTSNVGVIMSEREENMVRWATGSTVGTYKVPFTTFSKVAIPLVVNKSTAGTGAGSLVFSTYNSLSIGTNVNAGWDNFLYKPSDVVIMNDEPTGIAPNSKNAIDRFWIIDAARAGFAYSTKPTVDITFTLDPAEAAINGGNDPALSAGTNLQAQRFNPGLNKWRDVLPYGSQTGNTVITGTVAPADFFRSWTLSNKNLPLPIQLVAWEGECRNGMVNLSWTTASEQQNLYFTIEKSDDAQEWRAIGTVPGALNSSQMLQYAFTDDEGNGLAYYRLGQTDLDGTYTLGPVIAAGCSAVNGISIVNAWDDGQSLNLAVSSTLDGIYDLTLLDAQGKVLGGSQAQVVNTGITTLRLEKRGIATGIYVLQLHNEANRMSRRVNVH